MLPRCCRGADQGGCSCSWRAGRETWQHGSPYFANEAEAERLQRLTEALAERDQMQAFLGLTDTLVITAMYDLARLALALACHQVSGLRKAGTTWQEGARLGRCATETSHMPDCCAQLFQPRRNGLFTIHATAAPYDKALAESVLRRPASQGADPISHSSSMTAGLQRGGAAGDLQHSDTLASAPAPVSFAPSCAQVVDLVLDVVRDTLAVAAQASLGVTNHPNVRDLTQQIFGNTAAAAAILRMPRKATGSTAQVQRATQRAATMAASGAEQAAAAMGGGRTGLVLEQLRSMLHVQRLQEQLEDRVVRQYYSVMSHTALEPFVAQKREWALVCSYDAAVYRGAKHPPDKLHADLQLVRGWMESLAKSGTSSVFGIVHFDLLGARDGLLPPIVAVYTSMLSGLTGLMISLQKDLLARLSRYIDR